MAGALGHGAPIVRFIPGGGLLLLHTDPHAALEHLNAQLRNFDEEMGMGEYDAFIRLGRVNVHPAALSGSGLGARPSPVSDTDIAALPCFPYKLPRTAAAQACGGHWKAAQPVTSGGAAASAASPASPASLDAAPAPAAGDRCCGDRPQPSSAGVGDGDPTSGCGARERAHGLADCAVGVGAMHVCDDGVTSCGAGGNSGGGAGGLVCSVCLDSVAEGAMVMTLPCLHQFHAACVTPWLRQQGLNATCPLCKTPVFR